VSEPETREPSTDGDGLISRVKTSTGLARQRALETLERERIRNPLVRIAYQSYERDRRFAGGVLAGGLSYRLFLFLLPFSLFIVTAIGAVADGVNRELSDLAQHAGLGASLAASVGASVDTSNRGIFLIAGSAAVLTLAAGVGVIKTMRLISAIAWQVDPGRMTRRIFASAILAVGCMALMGFRALLLEVSAGPLAEAIIIIAEMLMIAAAVLAAYWVLPRAKGTHWTDLIPGAVLVTVGFAALRIVTIVWFANRLDRVDDLYGALGVATVFLAWLFIVARLLVAGAALNATLWLGRMEDDAPAETSEGEVSNGTAHVGD
jgi:uncharacterized BrkB/YihY/UPF0761 family membrane protein